MKEEYTQNVKDAIKACHARAGNICEHPDCSKPSVQVAHTVVKGLEGRRRVRIYWGSNYNEDLKIWGEKMSSIIHHKLNTHASCIKHNSYFLTLGNSKVFFEELMKAIHLNLTDIERLR